MTSRSVGRSATKAPVKRRGLEARAIKRHLPQDPPIEGGDPRCLREPWPAVNRWFGHVLLLVVAALLGVAAPASAGSLHRSWCHSNHTCPSDHHTYPWNGLYCTSYASERLATDTRTVSYD